MARFALNAFKLVSHVKLKKIASLVGCLTNPMLFLFQFPQTHKAANFRSGRERERERRRKNNWKMVKNNL